MVVISISVTVSDEQVVSGIPRTVAISTNVPATIFYTLDGSVPNLFSTIYTGPISLPVNQLTIILNILATNGTDSSPIVTETYQTDMVDGNARLPHAPTDVPPGTNLQGLYPFGDNGIQPEGIYGNPGDAGVTVDNPALPAEPTAFDGTGTGTGTAFTNQPFDIVNYNIKYSTTNAEGETGPGIGNLPANVKIQQPIIPPEESQQFSNMFDPKAFVIFQDTTKENPNDPPAINRMHFTLEDPEKARDGNAFFNTALDAPPVSGTFLRSHYNPRTNMITYYYLDTWTNRWIISTTPYSPSGSWDGNMAQILPGGGGTGGRYVFEWLPFTRRVLF